MDASKESMVKSQGQRQRLEATLRTPGYSPYHVLIIEKHNGAAGLEMEGAGSMQDGVLDDVHYALFGNGRFSLDLHDGAAYDGSVEERLSSHDAFDHDF